MTEVADPPEEVKLYALVRNDYQAVHPGVGDWPHPFSWFGPKGDMPGSWMPAASNVRVQHRGYHLLRSQSSIGWRWCTCICEAEGRGARDEDVGNGIIAFEEARLRRTVGLANEQCVLRTAAEIVGQLLPSFLAVRPKDTRPTAAAAYAVEEIDGDDMDMARQAAREAAHDVMHFARDMPIGSADYYRMEAAAHAAWAAWAIPTLHAVVRHAVEARENAFRAAERDQPLNDTQSFLSRLGAETLKMETDSVAIFLRHAAAELSAKGSG